VTARDTRLWTSGRAKVAAGRPVTDAEREVLLHFGGPTALPATPMIVQKSFTPRMPGHYKNDAELLADHHARMAGRPRVTHRLDMAGKLDGL